MVDPDRSSLLLVDGHVHVHACFDLSRFLDRAARNFEAVATDRAAGRIPPGVLMLTESAGDAVFATLRERAPERHGAWTIDRATEPIALDARRDDGARLVLVAGRQIATADGLEVLALGTVRTFADGRPLHDSIREAREAGAIAVVPWGFGKWSFGRGALVRRLVEEEDPATFFVGDNGGRPQWGPRPRAFALAEAHGIRVLPGSDPLPLPDHVDRAGSYGFALACPAALERPAGWLLGELRSPATRPVPFGRGAPLLSFVRNQVLMQVRKREKVA
jgi:hypothetical protein